MTTSQYSSLQLSDPNFDEIREELCGTKPPFVWVTQSNHLDVEFHTERHDVFNRFYANYTAITTPASGICSLSYSLSFSS